ncbi:MAG TPA: hypothetical protein V6D47_10160 [Oscillatoriaceae cyanobacterium]
MSAPTAPPTALPSAAPSAETPTVQLRTMLSNRGLAGAAVTVRRARDLSVLANGLKLDDQGIISLPLTNGLNPGTVVVVTATSGSAALSGLFIVPGAGKTLQQADNPPEWLLDLASSVVARKLTSKIADVLRTLPSNGGNDAVDALMRQLSTLVDATRTNALHDASVAAEAAAAVSQPTPGNIDALANRIILATSLQTDFVDAVEACNLQAYENMAAGGPLLVPAAWQVEGVTVPPVQVIVAGTHQLELVYEGKTTTLTVSDAAEALADAQRNSTTSNSAFAGINTPVVTTSSGGGGAPPLPPPPSLSGVVTVAGVARANALLQLDTMDGTLVAKTASDSNGAYAFFNLPDGVYQLIVAVDGAVNSTRIVTIGTPPPP